ncbi:MAG TPA: DNA-directed RNA polymerase subunit P [archaeon]|nr:DNA-directed RNA polymerase subunit P [archaeon]
MYKCMLCKKDFDMEDNAIRCPFCGYRIISKTRESFRKHVKVQ